VKGYWEASSWFHGALFGWDFGWSCPARCEDPLKARDFIEFGFGGILGRPSFDEDELRYLFTEEELELLLFSYRDLGYLTKAEPPSP
jgi:hypothetical protein